MKILVIGRKVFGSCWNKTSYCILLLILALTATPKAGADETSGSSKTLPIRTLSEIEASQENGRLTVAIKMNRLLEPTVFIVENPPRLVLDFPDTINRVPFKKLPLNAASVKRVRVGQFQSADPRIARVVFDLGEGFGTHRISLDKSSVQVTFLPTKTVADKTDSTSKTEFGSTESTTTMSVPLQKSDLPAKSGAPIETRDSVNNASRSPQKEVSSIRQPTIARQSVPPEKPAPAVPSAGSAKTAPSLEIHDSVESTPRLSQNSENIMENPKSTENRASSSEAKLSEGIPAEDTPVAHVTQASLEKQQEAPALNAQLPSVASQSSTNPSSLPLGEILDEIGKSVEHFREDFGKVACTEYVSQTKLSMKNSVIYKKDYEYDYMIFMSLKGNEMLVEESRQSKKPAGKEKDYPLLITEGFPTLLLIFHPYYQGSFKYKYIGEENVDGQNLIRIDFKHIQGRKSTSALRLQDKNYPLELQGTAWVDAESFNIRRIKSGLVKPLEVVGLRAFNSDVLYLPMQFKPDSPTHWMPQTATVEVRTQRQHWRNEHQFEDYRLFSVNTESNIAVP